MEIRRLATTDEHRAAYPVMSELRDHLSIEEYLELIEAMSADGYELWALLDDADIKALAGIALRTNFYYGRYLWVYDLITTEDGRSKGHGAALLGHVEELAKERKCDLVALSSGVQRLDAHRFYEDKMGYERVSFDFTKSVAP